MNTTRYEQLVGTLLEDGLTDREAEELAALVRSVPELRRNLRWQLALWELWSQQTAPERAAESFLASCHTRLRVERADGGESFLGSLRRRLLRGKSSGAAGSTWDASKPTARWSRPTIFAWSASLAAALSLVLIWFVVPRRAQAMTLQGEAVCTACILGETQEHSAALRVHAGDGTHIYYLEADGSLVRTIGNFCAAPIPVNATGVARTADGRLTFAVRALARHQNPPAPTADPPTDERVLFPF